MSSPASSLREPTPDPPAPEVHLISHGNEPVKKHEELKPIKLRILQPSGPKCSYKVATVAVSGDYNTKNHTEGEEVGSLNSGAHRWDSRLRTDLDRLLLDHEANAYMKTTANWNVESKVRRLDDHR